MAKCRHQAKYKGGMTVWWPLGDLNLQCLSNRWLRYLTPVLSLSEMFPIIHFPGPCPSHRIVDRWQQISHNLGTWFCDFVHLSSNMGRQGYSNGGNEYFSLADIGYWITKRTFSDPFLPPDILSFSDISKITPLSCPWYRDKATGSQRRPCFILLIYENTTLAVKTFGLVDSQDDWLWFRRSCIILIRTWIDFKNSIFISKKVHSRRGK